LAEKIDYTINKKDKNLENVIGKYANIMVGATTLSIMPFSIATIEL
jgi:hypothetical protein